VASARRRFSWLLFAVFLALILVVSHRYWLSALGNFLVKSEAPAKADMIVVLAGDYHGDRILTAADLVRQGYARQALISGPADFYGLHESDLAIPFAVRHGYPESYFVASANDSRSTVSEAEAVIAELKRRDAHRIDIVTSNFHTRRTRYIYSSRAQGIEVHVVAAPDPYFTPDGWWKNRDGRKIFLTEWMKTFATWLGM